MLSIQQEGEFGVLKQYISLGTRFMASLWQREELLKWAVILLLSSNLDFFFFQKSQTDIMYHLESSISSPFYKA